MLSSTRFTLKDCLIKLHMHTHVYVRTHTDRHVHTHTYLHTHACIPLQADEYTHTHACIHTLMHTHTHPPSFCQYWAASLGVLAAQWTHLHSIRDSVLLKRFFLKLAWCYTTSCKWWMFPLTWALRFTSVQHGSALRSLCSSLCHIALSVAG